MIRFSPEHSFRDSGRNCLEFRERSQPADASTTLPSKLALLPIGIFELFGRDTRTA